MRGLKRDFCYTFTLFEQVASFTDAWIETNKIHPGRLDTKVASFTDAWIETILNKYGINNYIVASFTDAWIETFSKIRSHQNPLSHLLQMRGLKHHKSLLYIYPVGRIFYRCVD